jgi:hypothetical protein
MAGSLGEDTRPKPVCCRAIVVAPVNCCATCPLPGMELLRVDQKEPPPVVFVTRGRRVPELGLRIDDGRRSKHSRHHTPPSPSPFAAESSFFPHPGLPSSARRLLRFASCPPQTKQEPCQRDPCGPGTTPRSIGDTDLWQPGQVFDPPKRGKAVVFAPAVSGLGS